MRQKSALDWAMDTAKKTPNGKLSTDTSLTSNIKKDNRVDNNLHIKACSPLPGKAKKLIATDKLQLEQEGNEP